jgi:hypothetical protein
MPSLVQARKSVIFPVGLRRLLLVSMLVTMVLPGVAADAVGFTWLSPADSLRFHPGDSIEGRWTSPSPVVTPSFRLCETGSGSNDGLDSADAIGDGGEADSADVNGSESSDEVHEESSHMQTKTVDGDGLAHDGNQVAKRREGGPSNGPPCGLAIWPEVAYVDGVYSVNL